MLPKLLFNGIMCPVLMHTKPVPALHTFFYYLVSLLHTPLQKTKDND